MGGKDRSVDLHFTLNQILSLSSDSLPLDYVILAGDITIGATSKCTCLCALQNEVYNYSCSSYSRDANKWPSILEFGITILHTVVLRHD